MTIDEEMPLRKTIVVSQISNILSVFHKIILISS